MTKPKFNLGDEVFYVYSSTNYGFKEPCKMCFGKRSVTLILGNGEHINSECGFCSHGLEYATGESNTWGVCIEIKMGVIAGITLKDSTYSYNVGYSTFCEHELFITKEDAEPLREAKVKEVTERRDAWYKDSFNNATKKQIWSAGYHRNCIKSNEQSIAWHKMRLGMIQEKKP